MYTDLSVEKCAKSFQLGIDQQILVLDSLSRVKQTKIEESFFDPGIFANHIEELILEQTHFRFFPHFILLLRIHRIQENRFGFRAQVHPVLLVEVKEFVQVECRVE